MATRRPDSPFIVGRAAFAWATVSGLCSAGGARAALGGQKTTQPGRAACEGRSAEEACGCAWAKRAQEQAAAAGRPLTTALESTSFCAGQHWIGGGAIETRSGRVFKRKRRRRQSRLTVCNAPNAQHTAHSFTLCAVCWAPSPLPTKTTQCCRLCAGLTLLRAWRAHLSRPNGRHQPAGPAHKRFS